ncbi:hypothetical protein ACFVJ8_34100 [Streptomyces yangpuensis]|nr:hypothetical protein [Streptomyces sp. NRRL S-378]
MPATLYEERTYPLKPYDLYWGFGRASDDNRKSAAEVGNSIYPLWDSGQ